MQFSDMLQLSTLKDGGPGADAAIRMLRRATSDDLLTSRELASLYLRGPDELRPDVVASVNAPEPAIVNFIQRSLTIEQLRSFLYGRSAYALDAWWIIKILSFRSGRDEVIRALASTMDVGDLTSDDLATKAAPRSAILGIAENPSARPDLVAHLLLASSGGFTADDDVALAAARNPALGPEGARRACSMLKNMAVNAEILEALAGKWTT